MTEATSEATTSAIPRVCQSCWFECRRRTCCFEFESMPASCCFCFGCRCSGACRFVTPSVMTSVWAGEEAPLLSYCWYSFRCCCPCCSSDAGTCEDLAYRPRPPREPPRPLLPPHLTHPGTTSSFSSSLRCLPWPSTSFVHRSECRSSCYCCEAEAEQTTQQSWMPPVPTLARQPPPPLRRWPRRLRRCPTRRRDPDPPTRDRRAWRCNWESLAT